jgi:protein-disulfide isomerase
MSLPKGPFVVAYSLFAVGALALVGVDTRLVQKSGNDGQQALAEIIEASPATTQLADTQPFDSQLAAIEPAEGPPAEAAVETSATTPASGSAGVSTSTVVSGDIAVSGTAGNGAAEEDETKKSFTGKVLSAEQAMPSISLGILKVETRKDLKSDAEAAFTPASLRKPETEELLKRRFHFTPYAHDAWRGNGNAPITLVEFSDLSCVACMDDLKKADELYESNKNTLRYIQVYLPVDNAHQTNLAAFYGKVAQRGGKFWEFRQALFDVKESSPEAYFNALVSAGVSAADARRWLATEARRFYRELDADAQLARALGLDKPPHFFIDGIHVGDGGIPRAQLADVLTYEFNYTHYQLDSLAHD